MTKAMFCWEKRGCGQEDIFDCPHDTVDLCPRSCIKSICDNPQYERASGMDIFSSPDVDFSAARKENCHSCKFFLKNAPRVNSAN